jgi:hypothetical protein
VRGRTQPARRKEDWVQPQGAPLFVFDADQHCEPFTGLIVSNHLVSLPSLGTVGWGG